MELKDIRVFVCVPAVGKTRLCQMDDRFVDLDDLKARYKYCFEGKSELEMERMKGNRGEALRKDSTKFIEETTLKLLKETDKILLFAPNPQMVEMIVKNKIPYCLVYHSLDCVEEYKVRMRERGNQENFIESMLGEDVIYDFYKASVTDTRPACKIELKPNQYLSDVLLDKDKTK